MINIIIDLYLTAMMNHYNQKMIMSMLDIG